MPFRGETINADPIQVGAWSLSSSLVGLVGQINNFESLPAPAEAPRRAKRCRPRRDAGQPVSRFWYSRISFAISPGSGMPRASISIFSASPAEMPM